MATFKQGINGPFRGKVGSVIGYQWRGIWVMRGLSRFKKKRTPKQLANQEKMRLMLRFLQGIAGIVRRGFHREEMQMSAFNAAMSYNKKSAIKGEYPNFEIDYSKVRIAQGELEEPIDPLVKQVGDTFEFSWNPKAIGNGRWNDQAILLAIEPGSIFKGTNSGNRREEGKEVMVMEKALKGMTFATYIAFVSDDRKEASNSVYCGQVSYV